VDVLKQTFAISSAIYIKLIEKTASLLIKKHNFLAK